MPNSRIILLAAAMHLMLLAVVLSPFAARSAGAEPLASEWFDEYAGPGPLAGADLGYGWTAPWSADASVSIDRHALALGESQAARFGGVDDASILSRPFPPTAETTYLGVRLRAEQWDDDFLQIQLSNGAVGDAAATLSIGVDGRNPAGFFTRIGESGSGSSFSTGPMHTVDTDYLLVGKFSKEGGSATYNRVDLFVNPGHGEPESADASRTELDATLGTLSLFTVRTALMEGPEQIFLDDIRVSSSFCEAIYDICVSPPDDEIIDILDYFAIRYHFGQDGGRREGDFNFDGRVDLDDFRIWKSNFYPDDAAQVPEPAGLLLMMMLGASAVPLLRRAGAPRRRDVSR